MKSVIRSVALLVVLTWIGTGCMNTRSNANDTIVIASYNVSMDASNYTNEQQASGRELSEKLAVSTTKQIQNIAEIIQRVRPQVILLNEFDYSEDSQQRIADFKQNYLSVSQGGQPAIDYPYHFVAPVNTGVYVMDGHKEKHGYGWFPGHYGMVILSQYPIISDEIRTFQHFLWKDIPDSQITTIKQPDGTPWYPPEIVSKLRLSSKSHWDVPININGKRVHVLASHPTPPVFDGPEDRNGKRNSDELRFWYDYLTPKNSHYIYDDNDKFGGFEGQRFVLMGDLNASAVEGNADQAMMAKLLSHGSINDSVIPSSKGGNENRPENQNSHHHTASWAMRADYAVPSKAGLTVHDAGVYWPEKESDLHHLIATRKASSDHRLVWIEVSVN